MAVTLLNSSGYNWGILSNETGIKAATFTIRCEPEFREPRMGLQNAIEGWAIGPMQRSVTIAGEISSFSSPAGVAAITAIVAFVPTNSVNYFGATTGGLYLISGEITNERAGWSSVSVELQSNEGVT